jgi:hypothetical protein
MMILPATILAALLVAPTPTPTPTATPPPPPRSAADDGDARARVSATEYIYENDNVSGKALKPGGIRVGGPRAAAVESLIRVRGTFLDRLHRHALDM